MQRRTKITLIAATPLAVAALLLGTAPANAQPVVSNATPPGLTVGDGYVIVNPASAVNTDDGTFYPTGPVSDDTLIVIPDSAGNLPNGLTTSGIKSAVAQIRTEEKAATTANSTSSHGTDVITPDAAAVSTPSPSGNAASPDAAAVTEYAWASTSAGYSRSYTGGSVIGIDWSAQANYTFDSLDGFNQVAAGLGKGHYRGYNGSEFGVWTTYYNLGSADSTGTSQLVPWGLIADNEGFEGWCATSTVCGGYFWN